MLVPLDNAIDNMMGGARRWWHWVWIYNVMQATGQQCIDPSINFVPWWHACMHNASSMFVYVNHPFFDFSAMLVWMHWRWHLVHYACHIIPFRISAMCTLCLRNKHWPVLGNECIFTLHLSTESHNGVTIAHTHHTTCTRAFVELIKVMEHWEYCTLRATNVYYTSIFFPYRMINLLIAIHG